MLIFADTVVKTLTNDIRYLNLKVNCPAAAAAGALLLAISFSIKMGIPFIFILFPPLTCGHTLRRRHAAPQLTAVNIRTH